MGEQELQDLIELIPNYSPTETATEGMYFDYEEAQRALDFFEVHLKYVRGEKAGTPFILEPWQKSIVVNLFGWKREDGSRRYSQTFIFIPRKNGKSFLIAGILTYICFCSGEPGSQVFSAAASREQASLIYNDMSAMIERNPSLLRRSNLTKAYKKIEIQSKEKCIFKSLSSEGKVLHGLDIYALCIDELHCISDREYLAALTTAQGARKNPLTIYITTAGVYEPHSPCYEKYDYSKKIIEGTLQDSSFLPVIYEADKEKDWREPETWKQANPNLGVSVSMDYLEKKCEEAKALPSEENNFKRLHLNLWTEQLDRWLPMDKWNACPVLPVPDDKALEWYGGLDLSQNIDLTCFSLVAQDKDGITHVKTFPFIPKDNITRREERDKVPFSVWAKDGYIELTEGDCIDHEYIRKRILELAKTHTIKEIAIDRKFAGQIINQLIADGFEVVPFGQGTVSMNSPCKHLERLILQKKINHTNHPVLNWCISNVTVKPDSHENIAPDKEKSIERIDAVVSMLMALGRLIQEDLTITESVYEIRGALSF